MRFEEAVQCCYDCYPSLFAYRWEVLSHLFCVYGDGGNGYRWKDGELVSIEDKEYTPRLAEGEKAHQSLDYLKAELTKYYTEIYENANMRHFIQLEQEIATQFPEQGKIVLSFEERIQDEVKKDIEKRKKVNFWLVTDSCAMFNIPDNVKPDWLEGIKETVELVLEHGFGEIKEMNDYEDEEYKRNIRKLYKVAKELGVME